MLTPKQIDTFVDNLKNAYSIASHLITEDSIRHFFIEALVANGISINDIAIEVPYVVNPSKKGKGKNQVRRSVLFIKHGLTVKEIALIYIAIPLPVRIAILTVRRIKITTL